jgi:hypothetical protein
LEDRRKSKIMNKDVAEKWDQVWLFFAFEKENMQ